MVKMEQERATKEREKEEQERRKRREEAARVKRMLEAAFDGDKKEIGTILQEVHQVIDRGCPRYRGTLSCPYYRGVLLERFCGCLIVNTAKILNKKKLANQI